MTEEFEIIVDEPTTAEYTALNMEIVKAINLCNTQVQKLQIFIDVLLRLDRVSLAKQLAQQLENTRLMLEAGLDLETNAHRP